MSAEDTTPRFVQIAAGDFEMGADDGDEDERPAHRVHLDTFHISQTEITNLQYAAFVRASGHPAPALRQLPVVVTPALESGFRDLSAAYAWRGHEPPRDKAEHPVTLVAYADAVAYCEWLSSQSTQAVRLPTEAEWERAARGDLENRRYPWGDDIDSSRANFLPDPAMKRSRGTRPVTSFAANGLGLSDMSGNVWEWVADWYRADAYRHRHTRNPCGPANGSLRLVRGGSWVSHDVSQLRCAHRHKVPADTYAYSIGFRVVFSTGPIV